MHTTSIRIYLYILDKTYSESETLQGVTMMFPNIESLDDIV